MKNLHVGLSPLTNKIYAGSVLKCGTVWAANKTDVTNEAIQAVVDHIINFKKRTGKELELSIDGVPVIRVSIEDLRK